MNIKLVKATKGKLLRHPSGVTINETGSVMRVDSFILRAEKDGDVTVTDAPKEKPRKPEEGGHK
jgi:hypothetical protein